MSIVHRILVLWLSVAVPAIAIAQAPQSMAQPLGGQPDGPSLETLRRMAAQLGTGQNNLPKIDPKTLELAREFLKKNPQILDDPKMKAQIEAMKQQMQQNPEAFRKEFEKGNSVTKEQFEQFSKGLPKPDPNNASQPPNPPTLPPSPDGKQQKNPMLDPYPKNPEAQRERFIDPRNDPRNNPRAQQLLKEEKARNSEGYRNMAGLWEKNIGSLDKTPAMKQTLTEMFGGTGGQGKGFGSGNSFGNQFANNGSNSNGFANWFKSNRWNGPPTWWTNMGNRLNFNGPRMPNFGGASAPSFGAGGFALSGAGIGTVGFVIFGLIVAAVIAFVLYRYWPQLQAMRTRPTALPGAGEWTIDPRDVRDRPTLIQAFEYVSLFLCGESAKVWNHATIAAAFVDRLPQSKPYAEPLARLYALARYTPEHEAFTAADIAEARSYLCQLAGVPNE